MREIQSTSKMGINVNQTSEQMKRMHFQPSLLTLSQRWKLISSNAYTILIYFELDTHNINIVREKERCFEQRNRNFTHKRRVKWKVHNHKNGE